MPEMPQDEVRNAVHAIVARVQADFEAELAKVEAQHERSLQQARDEISRDVREKVRSEVEASTAAEWAAKLDAARAESDRAAEASLDRLRHELEQASEAAVATARQEAGEAAQQAREEFARRLDQALAEEGTRVSADLDAERARLHAQHASDRQQFSTEIEAERGVVRALTAELEQAREALASAQQPRTEEALIDARAAERQEQLAIVERLLTAVRGIDVARSLSDTLTALTTAAGTVAPRVALFIVNGRELQGWRAAGFLAGSPETLRLPNDRSGLLATAAATAAVVSTATHPAPAFAALAADRAGLAVPVIVGGQAVAVLYADDGAAGDSEAPASWPEAVQILGAHASTCLAHITALRTAQAMRRVSSGAAGRPAATSSEEDSSARRYARLLVSEIKLYNESAVRLGREKRDLLNRLGPEIERARRLYEERVPASIAARGAFFQEELVHTLADGDRELLGSV
jgi:hypothetical protein